MKVTKTIKAAVVHLTKTKEGLLNREYDALQAYLHGSNEVELYSANKQQAKRFYKKIKPDKEYPLSIRKDLLRIEKRDTKIAKYWARVPVKGKKGGVWIAIKPHCDFPDKYEICESKLIRDNGRFFLNITIQKDIEVKYPSEFSKIAVIACDLGETNPITSVELREGRIFNPKFSGADIRKIRAHYNHIRKGIGKKKVKHALRIIKKIGHKEKRKVRDILHKETTKIVNRAKELREEGYEPIIVIGKLKGLRRPHKKYVARCRKNNRKVHSMPSYMITEMLKYKANWEGIPAVQVNEAWSSQKCHVCQEIGRRNKRLFVCLNPMCEIKEYNADLNGAINIGNRFLDHWLRNRALVDMPLSSRVSRISDEENALEKQSTMEEATELVQW